jgi:hypothetical protein
MPLRVISHYPDINAVDVPRNIYVKVEFNSGIIPGSVEYTHISVNDAATFATVPGSLGLEYTSSGVASIVEFQPLLNLTANTKYRVYVFGKPNSVISVGNEQLTSTYMWEFTTGTTLLEGQLPDGIPSGELPSSGVVDESGVIIDDSGLADVVVSGFRVISTDPKNQTPNVHTNLSGIYITFNTNIASSISELSGLVSVVVNDVLY